MDKFKWQTNLMKIWGFTTLLLGIGLLIQEILPSILKKYDYMEMFVDFTDISILLVISLGIFLLVSFVALNNSNKMSKYREKLIKGKSIKVGITLISFIFCLLFLLVEVATITSNVISAKNVESVEGKVDKVYSISEKTSGKVYKAAVISDSDGKQHKFVPSNDLETLDVSKKDKVSIDYLPSKYAPVKKVDGMIMGYEAHSK
ncbi:hypothetical protein [Staphylococcus equorum]|uniref:hypothetical protein n=1 Tax=Staphylococcus equorum TaxID=246432 RepID=UPI001868C83C|nr:hypothetical protein [Staphylococcus equorum]